jgi:hypothetical protein
MYRKHLSAFILVCAAVIVSGCSTQEPPPPSPTFSPAPPAPSSPTPSPTTQAEELPELHRLISQDQMFAAIGDLSALQP